MMRNPQRQRRVERSLLFRSVFCWGCLVLGLGSISAEAPPQSGLRTFAGRWVTIVTDMPTSPAVSSLPEAIDAAVPQWQRFWKLPDATVENWRLTLYLMADKIKFRSQGLWPPGLEDFPTGFQSGDSAWAVAQPSEYFTRHLVLHEAFHGFAAHVFRSVGANWFNEGTAELMATHRGEAADIRLPTIPTSREEVPYWGRFRIITARRRENRLPSLAAIFDRPDQITKEVEPYAWAWALVVMLTMYPEYRSQLLVAPHQPTESGEQFTRKFLSLLETHIPVMHGRWQLLLSEFDYGYDTTRNRIQWPADQEQWSGETLELRIDAASGWQSAGVRVAAGDRLLITAEGKYTLGDSPRPWLCEPSGVTVRYHDGHPLGALLVACVPSRIDNQAMTLPPLQRQVVGERSELRVDRDSWLLFRIGDHPGELEDNRGFATVRVHSR